MSAALPRLLLLTDRRACPRPLPEVLAEAVAAGARAVVLREKDLPASERAVLAAQARALLDPVGGLLVVAGGAPLGPASTAVHLAADEPLPVPRPPLVGRSCHDAGEAARAAVEGCDWVTLSPVWPTASKPGYGPVLGPAGLAALARQAPPAYALGGVTASRARGCLEAGAAGVAVMGAVMAAPRPGAVVAALLAALDGCSPRGNQARAARLEPDVRTP